MASVIHAAGWRSATRLLLATVILLIALVAAQASELVTFAASDGTKIYGDAYAATGPARGTVLAFHQAGSNRGEYAPIAPKLTAMGYNVLAIDQRSGGERWGQANRTAGRRGGVTGYFEALGDLEAALAYAKRTWAGTPVIVLGSSYSASLVFFLAAEHANEVAALLAFSPGEYFGEHSVREQAAKIQCPVFITSSPDREEVDEAKRLFDAVPTSHKTQYVPVHSVHGASALRLDSNPQGAAEVWSSVQAFLDSLPPPGVK